MEFKISCFKNLALHQRWRYVFCYIMHLINALGVVDNSDKYYLHNIITNICKVILKDAPVLPPHQLYQLKPKLLLKVNVLVYYQLCIPTISNTVTLNPSP